MTIDEFKEDAARIRNTVNPRDNTALNRIAAILPELIGLWEAAEATQSDPHNAVSTVREAVALQALNLKAKIVN